jgi:hypothetical protein
VIDNTIATADGTAGTVEQVQDEDDIQEIVNLITELN